MTRLGRIGTFCMYYARRPRVLQSHLGHARRVLMRDGVGALMRDIRQAEGEIRNQQALISAGQVAANGLVPSLARAPRVQGTILIVVHDMELGGAQEVARLFARWLLDHTRYDVKFVAMRDGAFRASFESIADTFCMGAVSGHPHEEGVAILRAWAGPDVKAIFLNSVASGGFYDYWPEQTGSVAFIHELPRILEMHAEGLGKILARADMILGGSRAVEEVLARDFGADPARLGHCYSYLDDVPAPDAAARAAARTAFGVAEDELMICGSGVLHWRKSPEIFIEVAERALARGLRARFIWAGGGPDQAKCESLIARKGIGDRVQITGYLPDIDAALNGADLFLLTSEEDPFPLTCLHAARAGAPVLCFEGAGGFPEFTAEGAGRALPFGDVDAMVEAIAEYAADPDLRAREGAAGRARVAEAHTVSRVAPVLLDRLRRAAGLTPAVSVVVPNYNYARFLPERLDSILNQTYQDFELILLDDASTDDSAEVLRRYAARWPGTRVEINETNTGSPFVQWLKGMRLARSPLVWLAEADDTCDPTLLETILPAFDDRNVMLGHVRSVPIGDDGAVLGDYDALYLDRINPGRWKEAFTATDHEEINAGLGIANSIPNASGVILRRFDPEPDFAETLSGMKLCGDWYFYLRALRGGMLAFHPGASNYHRRHSLTVTHRLEGSPLYFDELATVRRYIARTWHQGDGARAQALGFIEGDITRFPDVSDETARIARAAIEPVEPEFPALLMVVSDLGPGGGQMFGITLASEWSRLGGRVILHNAHAYDTHPAVLGRIDPRVALVEAGTPGSDLATLVERWGIDVVHSSIWWADRHVMLQADRVDAALPWVVTMHGCHETISTAPETDPGFPGHMKSMVRRVDAWAFLADKNRAVFDDPAVMGARSPAPKRIEQIVNGVPRPAGGGLGRAALGLRDGALVLCLASRAIPEKGWAEAVALTAALNAAGQATDLMLIGAGPEADALEAAGLPPHVHLYGQVSDVAAYAACADIGLLPTYFGGESFPLAVLEMMALGKPVVTTDAGMLTAIVGTPEDPGAAGIVVPLVGGRPDSAGLFAAVTTLADPVRREAAGAAGLRRFEKDYTVERMARTYRRLYKDLMAAR